LYQKRGEWDPVEAGDGQLILKQSRGEKWQCRLANQVASRLVRMRLGAIFRLENVEVPGDVHRVRDPDTLPIGHAFSLAASSQVVPTEEVLRLQT
jgi:hypothetical protein